MATAPTAQPRIRPDVLKLAKWADPLLWYAKAVAKMQTRPITDPTSWRYQAAIHGFDINEPAWATNDPLPSTAQQTKYWNQCQHGTWYFLPWHRMYLAFFEQTVAATIVQLGGPPGWSLPFWNYSDTTVTTARQLPGAFTDATAPFGGPNPLLRARPTIASSGNQIPSSDVQLDALAETDFVGHMFADSFGGMVTPFAHFGSRTGQLEQMPHNLVHSDIGGIMGDPITAGLDPIFWLHHANIDRLWDVWVKSGGARTNPTQNTWLSKSFAFHNAAAAAVTLKPSAVVDTTKVLDGYVYQTQASAPVHAALKGMAVPTSSSKKAAQSLGAASKLPPVLVSASVKTLVLTGAETRMSLSGPAPSKAASKKALAAPMAAAITPLGAHELHGKRSFLNLEGVKGEGDLPVFDVFVNLPKKHTAKDLSMHQVGSMPVFGIQAASKASDTHTGDGLHFVLDITPSIDRLKAEGLWDPGQLDISFLPRQALKAKAKISVDRVSLYTK